jgi:hypothetical protein
MPNLKARLKHLKQNSRRDQPVVVVIVRDGETTEQALARVNPRPSQLVIIIDR